MTPQLYEVAILCQNFLVLTNQKRVFIPYIFKRGYEPTDDVFEPMEYDDMKRLDGNIQLF